MDFKGVKIVDWKDNIEVFYELKCKNHSTDFLPASSSISFLAVLSKQYFNMSVRCLFLCLFWYPR